MPARAVQVNVAGSWGKARVWPSVGVCNVGALGGTLVKVRAELYGELALEPSTASTCHQ